MRQVSGAVSGPGRTFAARDADTIVVKTKTPAYNPDGTTLAGTPADMAREMVEIMDHVGGDGFLVTGQTTRHFLAEVVDGLVPALQDIGAVRDRYAGGMLRETLMEF